MSGRLISRLDGSRAVAEDLARAFPELDVDRVDEIASSNAELRYRLESLKDILPLICEPAHKRRWGLEGVEHVDAALQSGRGVILLTGHLGYSKLITPILRAYGYDATSVVAKSLTSVEREERIVAWLSKRGRGRQLLSRWLSTSSYERDCIPAQLDVRPIFSALASNRIVLVAGDGLKAAEFVHLPFLERTYPFAAGFMKIATMTGATLIPAFALEGKGELYVTVRIEEPLKINAEGSLEENLAGFAKLLESQVRSTPHLWYRWGSRDKAEAMSKREVSEAFDRWNRGVNALSRGTMS